MSRKTKEDLGGALLWICAWGLVFLFLSTCSVSNASEYKKLSDKDYYNQLFVPDEADTIDGPTPCCGLGDAYWADKVTQHNPDGSLEVEITDPRKDICWMDNGQKVCRVRIPMGAKIHVPASKLRHPPIPNPTGHNIVFTKLIGNVYYVYCFEPAALY